MNEIDIVFATVAELHEALSFIGGRGSSTKDEEAKRLALARLVVLRRKDVTVNYYPVSLPHSGLLAPCLCVRSKGTDTCVHCKELKDQEDKHERS